MKEFTVTVLGSSAAIATHDRNLTSQVVNHCNRLFLIDCGEGTQFRMRQLHIRANKIHNVFISHLHGDHFYGLIGLISTMHLLRRTEPLTVFGPPGLQRIIELQLELSETTLYYPLNFKETQDRHEETIYDDGKLIVKSFPLKHRIPTTGFLFKEKEQPKHINKEAVDRYGVPLVYYNSLRAGKDFITDENELIPNNLLTLPADPPRSYAYCSDTVYSEEIIETIQGCDLLYHESTFAHDLKKSAEEMMHSTNVQAAMIAKKAEVKKLLIGHFSARYDDPGVLLEEARKVFEETYIAEEGVAVNLSSE